MLLQVFPHIGRGRIELLFHARPGNFQLYGDLVQRQPLLDGHFQYLTPASGQFGNGFLGYLVVLLEKKGAFRILHDGHILRGGQLHQFPARFQRPEIIEYVVLTYPEQVTLERLHPRQQVPLYPYLQKNILGQFIEIVLRRHEKTDVLLHKRKIMNMKLPECLPVSLHDLGQELLFVMGGFEWHE